MKLGGQVACVTRKNCFNFGVDPDPDPIIFNTSNDSLPLRDRAINNVRHNISKCCGWIWTKLG